MLDEQQLLDAGFKKYPHNSRIFNYDWLFQKRITDAKGIKYFIEVCCWDRHKYEPDVSPRFSFNCQLQFTSGAAISYGETLNIEALRVNDWTVQMIEDYAENLFRALGANYYE